MRTCAVKIHTQSISRVLEHLLISFFLEPSDLHFKSEKTSYVNLHIKRHIVFSLPVFYKFAQTPVPLHLTIMFAQLFFTPNPYKISYEGFIIFNGK